MTFQYNIEDFKSYSPNEESNFDKVFEERWRKLHSEDRVCRYKLEVKETKILDGEHKFLFELNVDRHVKRRLPEVMTSVSQPFDYGKFNFMKAQEKEYIFQLQNLDGENNDKHIILINSSPICYGHSLFCPFIDKFLPQIITWDSLKLALHIMFLSNNRDLRVGFNSLCGMASVNHLHFHILIVKHRLPVEYVKCHHLNGPLYATSNYPAKCFCFQVKNELEIVEACHNVYKLISHLIENNVAHNLYMIKGKSFDNPNQQVIRILVWVRTSSYGAKETSAFNLAICEFSGQFPVKNQKDFDTFTEKDIIEIFDQTISPIFENILKNVIELY